MRVAEGVSVVGSGSGILPSFSASDLVYPVSPPHLHRPAVVVTTGPTGGGGLHLYGVLKGDKIYSVYLPMPGRSWVLQFCEHDRPTEASHRPTGPSNSVEIRLDPALVPPSVLEQYDFHRPPFSKPLAGINGMIILNGVIREDGAVGDLRVLQGILDSVDQAALAAFSRWRFSAALRADKPVAVDILVGIPIVFSGT
jgi:TonB family protein